MSYESSVFINCPFDQDYREIFDAIVFSVVRCGFVPKCAYDVEDGSEMRMDTLYKLIQDSKYGIHDISRTELNANGLPRFNMPLELGMFLGCKRFGSGKQKKKICLIMDNDDVAPVTTRYLEFISDLRGQEIKSHGNNVLNSIRHVRNVLNHSYEEGILPSAAIINSEFSQFNIDKGTICNDMQLDIADLQHGDFVYIIYSWIKDNVED
jgi:hypothetical protein